MTSNKIETAVFGGGCFWCTEAIFKELKGVKTVIPGYAGGKMTHPSYYDVSSGDSGHAEVIKIEFDPSVIPYRDLLDVFFHTHNPNSLNKQGNDVGTQYRSIILYTSEEQKKTAEEMTQTLQKSTEFNGSIVTEIQALDQFYDAESFHKDYYDNHKDEPYCQIIISPKLTKLREKYANKIK